MIEAEEYSWLIMAKGEPLGTTDELGKAEEILRQEFLADRMWTEEETRDRLTFDLKFHTWLLFWDRLPIWSFTAIKIPKL